MLIKWKQCQKNHSEKQRLQNLYIETVRWQGWEAINQKSFNKLDNSSSGFSSQSFSWQNHLILYFFFRCQDSPEFCWRVCSKLANVSYRTLNSSKCRKDVGMEGSLAVCSVFSLLCFFSPASTNVTFFGQ